MQKQNQELYDNMLQANKMNYSNKYTERMLNDFNIILINKIGCIEQRNVTAVLYAA